MIAGRGSTIVAMRGTATSVQTSEHFATNKALGKRPFRTPFTLKIPEGRGRTSGVVKYSN